MKLVVKLCYLLLCSTPGFSQNSYYVLFDFNKSEIPDSAMAFLVKSIYNNKVNNIYLEGHCDSIGSKFYNYELSDKRVKAVSRLLIENGFDATKIVGNVGYGKDKPLTTNDTEEDRQLNRRVLVQLDIEPENTQRIPDSTTQDLNKKTYTKKELGIPIENIKASSLDNNLLPTPKEKVTIAKPFKIENFKKNETIVLPNLNFQGGRHFLLPGAVPIVDSLLSILRQKPSLHIEIQGHVCCTTFEPDGYDLDTRTNNLSETRAIAIKAYLVKNGISSTRLKTRGFGGNHKLHPDESNPILRAQNRRVEIKILSE